MVTAFSRVILTGLKNGFFFKQNEVINYIESLLNVSIYNVNLWFCIDGFGDILWVWLK